ncbi:MAG: ATPase, partial [Moorea sp. SIO3C2]|nr:ATPase [Moorena sp. SIO3C2]
GVSTILVMGGSGDYFDVADTVIAMDNFQPQDVTEKAQLIAKNYFTERTAEGGKNFGTITPRVPLAHGIDPSRGRKAVKLKVRDVDEVGFGAENIDLSAVEQIVEVGQLRAISKALVYAKEKYIDERLTLSEILALVMKDIEEEGLDVLTLFPEGDLVQFRRLELAAALNRLRTLSVL